MTKAAVFSLHWDNVDPRLVDSQRRVMRHFGVTIAQHRIDGFEHGDWMDWVLGYYRKVDVVLFLDVDAIPLHPHAVRQAIAIAAGGSLFGCAQAAAHVGANALQLYAGPFFCAVSRALWESLGRPSAVPADDRDVGQGWTLAAAQRNVPVELWMPSAVEIPRWPLGDSGQMFGIGTTYNAAVYHLFEARWRTHTDRFVALCDSLLRASAPVPPGQRPREAREEAPPTTRTSP